MRWPDRAPLIGAVMGAALAVGAWFLFREAFKARLITSTSNNTFSHRARAQKLKFYGIDVLGDGELIDIRYNWRTEHWMGWPLGIGFAGGALAGWWIGERRRRRREAEMGGGA